MGFLQGLVDGVEVAPQGERAQLHHELALDPGLIRLRAATGSRDERGGEGNDEKQECVADHRAHGASVRTAS